MAATEAAPEPQPRKGSRRKRDEAPAVEVAEAVQPAEPAPQNAAEEPAAGPKPKRRSRKAEPAEATADAPAPEPALVPAADNDAAASEGNGELRRGWWQRTFG
jgi:ribonuclease E